MTSSLTTPQTTRLLSGGVNTGKLGVFILMGLVVVFLFGYFCCHKRSGGAPKPIGRPLSNMEKRQRAARLQKQQKREQKQEPAKETGPIKVDERVQRQEAAISFASEDPVPVEGEPTPLVEEDVQMVAGWNPEDDSHKSHPLYTGRAGGRANMDPEVVKKMDRDMMKLYVGAAILGSAQAS